MPDTSIHRALTRAALQLQTFDTGDNTTLVQEYCTYPDAYFSDRAKELEPYMFFLDGIQFHYLPDTPYTELYRYWQNGENGFCRRGKFVNENFRHAQAGFRFYITQAVRHLKQKETEEGKKFLGCLLHMLEDSTFGFHVLEGPGGADAFFLDRIMDSPVPPSDIMTRIRFRENAAWQNYTPRSLGNTPDEMLMNLYTAYCRAAGDSRKCAYRFITGTLANHPEDTEQAEIRMTVNAVQLCADVIHTVFQLAEGKILPQKRPYPLELLEPYEFPFGGYGIYRFRSITRDFAAAPNGEKKPLELDRGPVEHGIAFGSHIEGNLRYWIAPETFREFTAAFGLHPAFPGKGEIELTWINDGKPVETIRLNDSRRSADIKIPQPKNEFGLSFHSSPPCGVVVIAHPALV